MNGLCEFFSIFAHIWLDMAPYLLLGLLIAFFCSYALTEARTQRHLGAPGLWPIIKASILGLPLPLCSCGVLPVALALHHNGARKAAVAAFLASTPQSGADALPVTWSLLGPFFTIGRIISAVCAGLASGLLVHFFDSPDSAPPKPQTNDSCTGLCGCHHHNDEHAHHAGEEHHHEFLPMRQRVREAAHYAFVHLPGEIAVALVVGVAIAAGLFSFFPDGSLASIVPQGVPGYLIAMIVCLPMYACSLAVIPAAAVLLTGGVAPGVVFIFITMGPTTNAASLIILWRTLGRRATLLYTAGIVAVAVASAMLIDRALPSRWFVPPAQHEACCAEDHDHAHDHDHHHGGDGFAAGAAILFAGLMAHGWLRNRKEHAK